MRSLDSLPSQEAGFVEPMECLAVAKLPDGPEFVYEIKFDGYRALAINANGKISLYSRNKVVQSPVPAHFRRSTRSAAKHRG